MLRVCLYLCLCVSGCANSEVLFTKNISNNEQPIVIQLNWLHQFQFAGYYAAVDQGYFRDEELTVLLKEGGPNIYAVNEVLEKKAHYGIGSGGLLLQRLQNKPLVVIASIFQHSAATLAVSSLSNINTPHDLVGKQVNMLVGGKPIVEIAAMLEYEGIALDNIKMRENRLITETETYQNVEFIYSTNSPYFIKKNQLNVHFIKPISYGIDFYGDSLFTTENEIKQYPYRVKKIRRAVIKGWQYALQHPNEIIKKMLTKYKVRFTSEHLEYEAGVIQQLILPNIVEVGHSNASRWKRMADTMIRLKMIPSSEYFDGFVYQQNNNEENSHVLWGILGFIATLASIIFLISIIVIYINHQLKKRIALKTFQLQNTNNKLESIVNERTQALHLEIKKYQQSILVAKKANKAQEKFLATISHEIRTPLNAVIGSYFLLKRTQLTSQQEKHLQQIYISSQSLCHIIDDILDLSKAKAGTLTFKATNFDLRKLAQQLKRNFITELKHKNITLNTHIASDIPIQLNGFELRLMQVLNNLLSNAIKFSHENTMISLYIDSTPKDSPKGQSTIRFNVIDCGIGIEKHHIKQLFRPFRQVNDSLSRNYTGTGLGLSISQSLVKVMGGKIHCHSTLNKGSSFYFSIPFKTTLSKVLKTTKIINKADVLSSLHLLIVDDNKLNLFIAEAFIKPYVKKITTVSSAKEAIALCNKKTFAIILMDIQMPIMDGYQATYHIRQNRNLSYLPIIAMTAHASPEDREKSIEAGMNDHISKPLDPDILLATLRKWA